MREGVFVQALWSWLMQVYLTELLSGIFFGFPCGLTDVMNNGL